MNFPFSVHFERRLRSVVTDDNQQQILQYIAQSILKDKADNIVIENMTITYKDSTSNWRGSLFGSVDNGIFNLIYKNNCWFLNYQISMKQLFIATGIMATVMGVFAQVAGGMWWVGIVMFLWLCGGNWVTSVIRHGFVATELSAEIDELICGKIEVPKIDKMNGELKSWF